MRSLVLIALALLMNLPATAADVTLQLPATDGFVIQDSTGAIERLRVDESSGNISRNGGLFVHTTGIGGTFFGDTAGNIALTGNYNTVFGDSALEYGTSGSRNSAFGSRALRQNTTGSSNVAFGHRALTSNTIGTNSSAIGNAALASNTSGQYNSAVGSGASYFNTTGSSNAAFGRYSLFVNSTGDENAAFGHYALRDHTGSDTAAFGSSALRSNTTGLNNSAFGQEALYANTTGGFNSAFGQKALRNSVAGFRNSAFGRYALFNASGNDNNAFGINALANNTTGQDNLALGGNAGLFNTTGSDNIFIENNGFLGQGDQDGQIIIGNAAHTDTFIEGIFGNTSSGGSAVFIDSNNELGTLTSSARFKERIRPIDESSDVLAKLRPVAFYYREDAGGDGKRQEYGLLAEEVAEVAPQLVVYDEAGKPYTVRYHLLTPMLLNELQKAQTRIARLEAGNSDVSRLRERVAHLEAQLSNSRGVEVEAR